MSRVLVTGGSGFIGTAAVEALVASGQEVHATYSSRADGLRDDVVWHQADLLAPYAAERLADAVQASHLLHLAWYAAPGLFWQARENTEWISASLRLLDAFAHAGGTRAVMAGSCAEYRWGDEVLSETHTPLEPATLYGACKHATHVAAAALAAQLDVQLAWGRVFFVYGPGEAPGRLVASLMRGLLTGQRVPTTSGEQVRDFMHVGDVGAAFARLVDGDIVGPVNVASGRPTSIRALVNEIGRATGHIDRIDFGAVPQRLGDPPVIVGDARRLQQEVGFRPRVKLSEGIEDVARWWRDSLAS